MLCHSLLRWFDDKSLRISFSESQRIARLVDLDDYHSILAEYGQDYCLIILQFFEDLENYDTCAEIVKQLPQIRNEN